MEARQSGSVTPLRRAHMPSGTVSDLRALTAEMAAIALVDTFRSRGYAEARVADVASVRALVRRDCRKRRLPVQTIPVGDRVAVVDEPRHRRWLQTPEGREHSRQSGALISDVVRGVLTDLTDS